MGIPLNPNKPEGEKSYLIQFNDGTTKSAPVAQIPALMLQVLMIKPADETSSLLPPFLQLEKKVTHEHDGQFYRGCLGKKDGVYCFIYKRHQNSKHKE